MASNNFYLRVGILFFLMIVPILLGSEDSGCKYYQNYSNYDYNHQPQNWGIAQDSDGIIYVANQGGVLIYDGTSWKLISTPGYTLHARSLDIDKSGIVYIGGENEIGYLDRGQDGSLEYVSLLDFVPEDHRNFSVAFRTHAASEGIFYRTSKYLFHWNGKQINVLCDAKSKLKSSFVCQGNLYVQDEKNGLSLVINNTLKPLPGTQALAADAIYMMAPYQSVGNTQTFLIGSRESGLFLYDGIKTTPFPVEFNAELDKNRQSYGTRLSTGDFAVATLNGGLFIMDTRGHLKYSFNKSTGLQDNNIKFIFEDRHENLWLALNKGISRLEYNSPFFFYDDRTNLPGMVISIVRNQDDLYVGTTQGLYFLSPGQKNFLPISGISGNCWSVLSLEYFLLAATTEGIFQVDPLNKAASNIHNCKAYSLLSSRRFPDRIWCGTDGGLLVLTGNTNLRPNIEMIEAVSQPIRYLAEDSRGSLWLVTLAGAVLKADFPADLRQPVVSVFDKTSGLPEGEIYAVNIAGHLVFATNKGLYQPDQKSNKFIPDFTLGEEFAGGSDGKPIFRLMEDNDKHIWFQSESRLYTAFLKPGSSPGIQSQIFLRLPTVQVNEIYPDPFGTNIWFGSNDGLIRFDKTVKKDCRQDFKTLIRSVTANGKTIADTLINKNNKPGELPLPVLKYKDRNIQFEYAAPFFEPENETMYHCILEGYDHQWSSWDKDYKKLYTNLDPGRYTFRVQAKNIYEHLGSTANFQFKILPPWYKTWWALLIYMAATSGAIFLLLAWRAGNLRKEKNKLELIVKERTKEINEKNFQLENQTHQLKEQSEQLKEMDVVKSRFFANISHEFRTPLTLIMSPLEQILSENPSKSQQERINLALRNSHRLLTLINQLLELSRFDSGKMKLQAANHDIVAFLRFIVQSFQILALQNQLEMEFVSTDGMSVLYFDGQKMEEVMYNLLINAVKFTLPGGKITVEASYDSSQGNGAIGQSLTVPGYVKISVKDTGIGIPREQLPHVFDRFFQAGAPQEIALKGTGIGLALTKEIINLHQGKIDIHSQEGKGTEIVIRLPMGNEHLAPDQIIVGSDTPGFSYKPKGFDGRHISIDKEIPPGKEDYPPDGQDANEASCDVDSMGTEKTVVLVVEDHEDVRRHIRDSLIPYYSVIEAGDGKAGICKAREIIPDLVVSDIMMPGVDGFELCKTLKKDINTSHIPIILLTAKASEESIIRGLETGADDYITKPFNTRMLLTRIKNLIELRRQLQLKIQRRKMLLPIEISVSSMDDIFLKEFQEMIEKNLADPDFDVDQLCDKLYIGKSSLYRKVQALTGEAPNQFIQSYRLERAAQLLRDNYGNVTEVAMAVGFSSSTYFATCFKEKFHQSPSAFKASECKSS